MKKLYTILSGALIAALLLVGFSSLLSLDKKEKAPSITGKSFFNGEYGEQLRAYYGKAFPQPEGLKAMNVKLNGFYHYSGLSEKDEPTLVLSSKNTAADGGSALSPKPQEGQQTTAPSTEAPPTTNPLPAGVKEEQLGDTMLVGDRAVEVPFANHQAISDYAGALDKIAGALGKGVRVFSVLVPNSAEFYTSEKYHTGENSQSAMISECYDKMGGGIHKVDAYSEISKHVGEYIYFRTDHHWTQLGAYYAYYAFCVKAGMTPEPLSRFETGSYEGFLGSMYNVLEDYPQSAALRDHPDSVHYYRPFVDLSTTEYLDGSLSNPTSGGTLQKVNETSNKYLCFLGGDHPITIIETSAKGPVCLLVKESYGNCFAPWLTSHYSKVICVDPREFNRDGKPSLDLKAFAEAQGVADCIVLNYPMMLNSSQYIEWLNRLVP